MELSYAQIREFLTQAATLTMNKCSIASIESNGKVIPNIDVAPIVDKVFANVKSQFPSEVNNQEVSHSQEIFPHTRYNIGGMWYWVGRYTCNFFENEEWVIYKSRYRDCPNADAEMVDDYQNQDDALVALSRIAINAKNFKEVVV